MNRGMLGEELTKLRKERGFTQSELADRTDVSRTTINNVEKGEQSLTLELFIRISEALGYEAPRLLWKLLEPQDLSLDAKSDEELQVWKIVNKTIQSSESIDNNKN